MLCQRNGLSLQSQLRPLSALVFHLLLTDSVTGQLMGPSQPVVATVGDDIILPCHLEPAVDVAAMTLEWTRPDLNPIFVLVWRAGQDYLYSKDPSYKGRTSLFTDELKRGNISLKLSDVRPSDAGRYRCFIPKLNIDSFVELVVGAMSSPVITLAGIDRDKGGVVLQCESAGWYPEPEVLWLDSEGKLLSAGPTETVRGPDDLYTVSSRVTVEKRHSNSFTCRVQQRNINQARETHISVSDDFFQVQSCSTTPVVTGLAVGLALCIMLLFAVVLFVCKQRQNKNKTRRSHRDETDKGEKKNRNRTEDQFVTDEEMKALKGKGEKKNKHDHNLTSPASRDSAKRHITVDEVDLKGKYVRLSNKSEKDQPMGDWELHIQVNKRKPIKYQFKHSFILKAGNTVTIWASGCGVSYETSTDLVWFGQKSWGTGEELLVTIYSNTGEIEVRKMLALHCDITVSEIDLMGSYVRLSNTSKKDQAFKGWELHIEVNDRKPVVYKFSHSFKLKPGKTVTIWSSDHPDRNKPPTDLVWQNQKSWGTGEELLVTVYNNTGEEVARKLEE